MPKERPAAPPPKVVPPKLVTFVDPAYPEQARQAGIEGEVILVITVGVDGRVSKAGVRRGAGHGFDEAAVAAGRKLVFEPARMQKTGKFVAAKILFRFTFELQEHKVPPPEPVKVISGTVIAGGEPVAGAEVAAKPDQGKVRKVRTDEEGRFAFIGLSPGEYSVTVEAEGLEPFVAIEQVAADDAITVRYSMTRIVDPGQHEEALEVIVRGERQPREVTRRKLTRRELDRIPGTKGDALRGIENLPGVARPPPFIGLLIVRGSAPGDSITFFDGVPVPLAYHFGGIASVVPTEMLERLDFYPGNFGSEYGRATGGVVDVRLRSPRTDGYHGFAQVDFIDGRLQLEGPVPWTEDWSFMMAGRRSWIDAILTPALEAEGNLQVAAPVYYDYQFMVENKPDHNSRFRLGFYGSDDAFALVGGDEDEDTTGSLDLGIAFQRLQLSYSSKLPDEAEVNWSMAFGRDVLEFEAGQTGFPSFLFNVETFSLNNRLTYSRPLARWLRLKVGADLSSGLSVLTTRLPVKRSEDAEEGRTPDVPFQQEELEDDSADTTFFRPAGFVEAQIKPLPTLRFVPGLRIDADVGGERVDVAPRFNASYGLFDGFPQTTIKGAVGLYHQPPTFFQLLEPDRDENLSSSHAVHYSLGLEQDLTRQLEVSVEGFVKTLDNLVVTPSDSTTQTNDGSGLAVGGEVLVKYKPDKYFFGWLAYTLSRSSRRDGPDQQEYLAAFDQTHILTVLGSFRLPGGWELGSRFRLVSGNLLKPTICNPEETGCDTTTTNAIYHAQTGTYVPFPTLGGDTERLPLFHQLDFRVDKTWTFDSWKLGAYIDILNLYSHQSAEGIAYSYNYAERDFVGGLPIVPSFGLRGSF